MAEADIYVVVLGLKLALSLALVVLAFSLDTIARRGEKHIHGLNIMALALLVLGFFEFFEDMASIYSGLPVIFNHDFVNSWIKLPSLLIAGLGIIWYLSGINKNIKEYY